MRGNKLKLIILIFSCHLFAVTESISLHYNKGLDAYRNNQYDLAIQEFENILDNNWIHRNYIIIWEMLFTEMVIFLAQSGLMKVVLDSLPLISMQNII